VSPRRAGSDLQGDLHAGGGRIADPESVSFNRCVTFEVGGARGREDPPSRDVSSGSWRASLEKLSVDVEGVQGFRISWARRRDGAEVGRLIAGFRGRTGTILHQTGPGYRYSTVSSGALPARVVQYQRPEARGSGRGETKLQVAQPEALRLATAT